MSVMQDTQYHRVAVLLPERVVENRIVSRIHGSNCGHILRCQHEIPDVEIFLHPLPMYRFGNGDNSAL